MKVQEAYRTPNRLDQKKIPSPYNNQNIQNKERILRAAKKKDK